MVIFSVLSVPRYRSGTAEQLFFRGLTLWNRWTVAVPGIRPKLLCFRDPREQHNSGTDHIFFRSRRTRFYHGVFQWAAPSLGGGNGSIVLLPLERERQEGNGGSVSRIRRARLHQPDSSRPGRADAGSGVMSTAPSPKTSMRAPTIRMTMRTISFRSVSRPSRYHTSLPGPTTQQPALICGYSTSSCMGWRRENV